MRIGVIGVQGDVSEHVDAVARAMKDYGKEGEAIANLEEVEVAAFAGEIANFRIFGPQSASRLTTSINSTMAVLRPALYVTLSGAIALGALVIVLF